MGARRPDLHLQAASLHRDDYRVSRTIEVYGRTLKFINGHAIPRTHHLERVNSGPAGVRGGPQPELDAGLSATTSRSTSSRTRASVRAG